MMGNDKQRPRRLNLVERGDVRDHESRLAYTRVDAVISETGDLTMEGQDFGKAAEEAFGDDEYEYFVTVFQEHKDRVLLHLIKDSFAREPAPTSAFMEWLKRENIPYEFISC